MWGCTTLEQPAPAPAASPDPEPSRGSIEATVPSAGPPPSPTCAQLRWRAVELAGTEVDLRENREPLDFDRDGQDDCVFYGYSTAHLFVRTRDHDLRAVGDIPVRPFLGVRCTSAPPKHSYCVIQGAELMIHGETRTTNYAFDGTRYVPTGESHMGPRKR